MRVPVIGVIEPGSRAAVGVARGANIGVIATEATVNSGAYAAAIAAFSEGSGAESSSEVIERACPLFVSLAEEGWANSDVARLVARDYLADFSKTSIAALVLGCTHYPILRDVISETVGTEVTLIDSGAATAADVESLLETSALTHDEPVGIDQERRLCDDLDHFYVTDAAERFAKVAERFLGSAPSILEAVEIWGHDELRTH
jgi:glutamate racemase